MAATENILDEAASTLDVKPKDKPKAPPKPKTRAQIHSKERQAAIIKLAGELFEEPERPSASGGPMDFPRAVRMEMRHCLGLAELMLDEADLFMDAPV